MPRPTGEVYIDGLRQFQRDLRAADRDLPKELKRSFDEIGRSILVPEIVRRIKAQLKDQSRTRLISSVRAQSQQREGRILEGKASTPHAGWWEFGGSTKRKRGGVDREFITEGRSLYPALGAKADEIHAETDRMIDRLSAHLRS